MTVTKFSDLPPTPLSPVGAYRSAQRAQTTAGVAMAKILTHTLKRHQDPVVVQIISELEEICINPWMRAEVAKLGEHETAGDPDFYDLVLPTDPKKHVTIGSSSQAQIQLPETAACAYHVRVTVQEKDGDRTWMAEVRPPMSSDDFHTATMKIGEETHEARNNSNFRHRDDGPKVVIKPGDVIEIGLSHIRLHAPEPEQASE